MKAITLTKTIPVTFLLYGNNVLESVANDLSFTLSTNISETDDMNEAQIAQNISFSTIQMFVENILDQSIVLSVEDIEHTQAVFNELANNIILLPDTSESTLAAALHCKFNSIITDNSVVATVTLLDKVNELSFCYTLFDDVYDELPGKSEWNPEFSFWSESWWNRNDISTLDKVAADEEEYALWLDTGLKEKIANETAELFGEIEAQFRSLFPADSSEAEGALIEVDFEARKRNIKLVD